MASTLRSICSRQAGDWSSSRSTRIEDRIVKRFMQAKARGCICPPDLPQCVCGHEPEGMLAIPKALAAKRDELERNPRAQSARMRAIVKASN